MSEQTTFAAQLREDLGTSSARNLRRTGMVPAIIYGKGKDQTAIALEEKEMTKLYRSGRFSSTVLELEVKGKKVKVLGKSLDLDPISEFVSHVDFMYLGEKEHKVDVPVIFSGKERSIGVKRGGFFNIVNRKLPVICPSNAIPSEITVNVEKMQVGSTLKAGKVALPEGCRLAMPATKVIASITGRGGKSDDAEDSDAEGASEE